ncbi:hypothetical protein BD289DRAFT_75930 [Coniella lustricola]|uniref:Ceramide glucosyltransferase n=1 Tax=Coniella lustricola TaxID=2025994 RepID=A0A2T2ZZF7_9PEZI|nr:hypothetical protein BD289DRAFT_75930 [Coniella lustricola]
MTTMEDVAVYAAIPALLWSSAMYIIQSIGILMVFLYYSYPPRKPVSSQLPLDQVPHVTVIRPVKGLEPELYECLASTFRQDYPASKLSVDLCVASEDDPAYPVLEQIVQDFSPTHEVRLLVEEYDPLLSSLDGDSDANDDADDDDGNDEDSSDHGHDQDTNHSLTSRGFRQYANPPSHESKSKIKLGPNPKIRNISRAYREAKGELIWIIDCNVWVSRGVAGRMVDRLMGFLPDNKRATPFRFVHHMPLVVDVASAPSTSPASSAPTDNTNNVASESLLTRVLRFGGGRLDEMFMATSHAKFYGAINTVGAAPCIIGKSNMFRKAHLDTYTHPFNNPNLRGAKPSTSTSTSTTIHRPRGVDFFSNNICEDHLIGDLLWKAPIPGHNKHGLVWGDLALQPVRNMSVASYCARRVRWLRARKWTVLIATLVEPGVEALLCNLYFAYAITTLPWFHATFGLPRSWTGMVLLWVLGLTIWMSCDRAVYRRLHKCLTVEVDSATPAFARGFQRRSGGDGLDGAAPGASRKGLWAWVVAWIGREVLALPIWTWAVLLGSTVTWRGRTFRVHRDMTVVELKGPQQQQQQQEKKQTSAQNGNVEGEAANGNGIGFKQDEFIMQDTPKWEDGRPTARHRKSRNASSS